jgi:hypothetical protein
MKPVEVSTVIRRPIAEVYAHLDVLANHEAFTDHFLVDWRLAGPASGVGASVTMTVRAPGRSEEVELTVIEAEPPVRTVEETVGAAGPAAPTPSTRSTPTAPRSASGSIRSRCRAPSVRCGRSAARGCAARTRGPSSACASSSRASPRKRPPEAPSPPQPLSRPRTSSLALGRCDRI